MHVHKFQLDAVKVYDIKPRHEHMSLSNTHITNMMMFGIQISFLFLKEYKTNPEQWGCI
jgi:hypothetical protein